MTVQTDKNQNDDQPRVFRTLREIKPEARPEQTDAEIEAWMEQEIRADKKILDLLATL
ncbi:hypothetical protein [Deinococcus sp. Arct2-2]|uniref:hypothetical protein n=1 Tax=Deinococcus sp. Arct2-2 TaxID=2568653 RepID=UPI001454C080|nr:hypothetical protein [Deinococcus sp. Arct2-2]